jgi:chromosome segregation ATPase
MTQANSNGSRLDRIEAILLDLAAGSVRHDNMMAQHAAAIARHDEAMVRHDEAMAQHAAAMVRHDEEFSRINTTLEQISARQATIAAQQEENNEQIARLTASIVELRNVVADNIRQRES